MKLTSGNNPKVQSEWMTLLHKVLETCLYELENGGDPELTLEIYPEVAAQIHPILDDFVRMTHQYIPDPSPEAMLRGRAKLLELAQKKN
jgi:hypothetical protein